MFNNIKKFDVIIIGGGPSGLKAADFLSRNDLSVALFEKDHEIGNDVICSGVISEEAFRTFELPQDAVVNRLKEAVLHSPSNKKISYSHPQDSVYVVDRKKFDKSLGLEASRSGAEIFLNCEVKSLVPHKDYIEAKIKTNERFSTVRSEIAVIATGVSYNLQSSLKMGRPKKILKGIQVELNDKNLNKLKMFWGNNISKGFFGWAIPLNHGKAKIGVISDDRALHGLKNILTQLNLINGSLDESICIKRKGISFGTIKKNFSDRILAIGEAAGFVKTTTGGGIYYGLISADIASRVILDSFKVQRFDADYLSKYQKLSMDQFSKEILFGEYFHRFFSVLNDNDINSLFDAAKRDNLLSYISQNGKFDWHTNTVLKILKSPNLRKVLLKGIMKQGTSKFVLSS